MLITVLHLCIFKLSQFIVSAVCNVICIVVKSYSKSDTGEPSPEM